jgi:aspartate/methionine/tyrosine aminotransferase
MGFDVNNYLSWYIPRVYANDGAINLHASGMPALATRDLEIPDGAPFALIDSFEEKLAEWLGLSKKEVIFTHGATGGTLLVLLGLVPPGRELVVEAPVYEPLARQAERIHPVRRFSRKMDDRWQISLSEVEGLLSEKTGLVMITEPSNPSGTFVRREEILTLADLAARRGALLLINEVYRGFSNAASFHGERDNIVVVSSMTKLLGTYGLRLGWVSAPATVINRLRHGHRNMGMPAGPAAAAGIGVLKKADRIRAEALALSESGRETVEKWAAANPEIKWTRPDGPPFACIQLPGNAADDVHFAETLQAEHGVLVVPGAFFEAPGTIRIGWLQSGSRLEQGLERLGAALKAL